MKRFIYFLLFTFSFSLNANEIGNVEVTAEYVTTCEVNGLPVASVRGEAAFEGTFRFVVSFSCRIGQPNTLLRLWVERFLIYPDEANSAEQHYMVFYESGSEGLDHSLALDDGAGGAGPRPYEVFVENTGFFRHSFLVRARVGVINNDDTQHRPATRFESFSRLTPVHVEVASQGAD